MIEHLLAGLHLFRSQKGRFLLTVSGIVVGVGSLILLASLLGVGKAVLQRASSEATGDDVITVNNDWGVFNDHPEARRLDHDDQDAMERSTLLDSATISANYNLQEAKGQFEGKDFSPMIIGVSPTTFEVFKLEIAKGRLFDEGEYSEGRRVAIVGANVLDGGIAPGQTIRIDGRTYVVVGVMAKKAEMGPGGRWSWNNRVLFPERIYNLEFNPTREPQNIVVKVVPPPSYDGLLKDYSLGLRQVIDGILGRDRKVKSWELQGVREDSSTEVLIFRTIELLIYMTTAFSMLVGGINIMNIMLVSVAERTREIGLRRALGATRSNILRQFLAETVAVTLIGATLGVIGAMVLLAIASAALTHWVTEWPFHVEGWALGLAVASSVGIGLISGMYPAFRASRLDPVEALRTE